MSVIFPYPSCQLYIIFGEVSVLNLCPVFKLGYLFLSFEKSLVWLQALRIFSGTCVFILLTGFIEEQQF